MMGFETSVSLPTMELFLVSQTGGTLGANKLYITFKLHKWTTGLFIAVQLFITINTTFRIFVLVSPAKHIDYV